MKTQAKTGGKRHVVIVGSIVSGRSGDWFGRVTGTETVMKAIGTSGDIDVYINSPGGSVFAGFEILNALNAATSTGRAVTIYVSPMAASMASYITSGVMGAKVYMAANAKLMFHAPWTGVQGSKSQLLDTANLLGKMEVDIQTAIESRGAKCETEWFAAGRATWFSAKEAIAAKLADGIANPPPELLAVVTSPEALGYSMRDGEWDMSEEGDAAGGKPRRKISPADLYAASASFEGYLLTACEEHFPGETIEISDVAEGHFRMTKSDGSVALLNYRADSLNIVAIDWDSTGPESKLENTMKTAEQIKAEAEALAAAEAKAKADAEAAAKAESDAKAAAEAKAKAEADAVEAKAKADAEAAAKAESDAKAAAEAKAKAEADAKNVLPAGLTADMIAFAKKNYQAVRDEHIVAIKACKENTFSDAELGEFSIEMLAKMAKLSAKPAAEGQIPGVDNSLTAPSKVSKGTGGTLPPPEQ